MIYLLLLLALPAWGQTDAELMAAEKQVFFDHEVIDGSASLYILDSLAQPMLIDVPSGDDAVLTFVAGDTAEEILTLRANGEILWRDRLVTTDSLLVAALKDVIQMHCPYSEALKERLK